MTPLLARLLPRSFHLGAGQRDPNAHVWKADPAVVTKVGTRVNNNGAFTRELVWPALLGKAERLDPSFAD